MTRRRGWFEVGSVFAVLFVLGILTESTFRMAHSAATRDLSSSQPEQRYLAVEVLKRNWETQMGPVLKEISGFRGEIENITDTKDAKQRLYFRGLTDALRAMINQGGRDAIKRFRSLDDHDVITTLVRAARGRDRGIRINATIILANVSDNSSVCIPIDELRDPKISDNGRINLLQVVLTVASYMYQENWQATTTTLRIVRSQLDEKGSEDFAGALKFMKEIDARLARNDRKETPAPARHKSCAEYQYRF